MIKLLSRKITAKIRDLEHGCAAPALRQHDSRESAETFFPTAIRPPR